MTMAIDLAKALNCPQPEPPCGTCASCNRIAQGLHADIRVLELANTESNNSSQTRIGIGQIRSIQKECALKPYEGKTRVIIINNASLLTEEASNALLKTLEEPPNNVTFIILAPDKVDVLPTILSRCNVISLRPVSTSFLAEHLLKNYEATETQSLEIARISGGRPGWAINAATRPNIMPERKAYITKIHLLPYLDLGDRFSFAQEMASLFSKNRTSVFEQLVMWEDFWRDVLITSIDARDYLINISVLEDVESASRDFTLTEIIGILKKVKSTIELLKSNANPRLTLDSLILYLPHPRSNSKYSTK